MRHHAGKTWLFALSLATTGIGAQASARVVSVSPRGDAATRVEPTPVAIDPSPYEDGEAPGCASLEVLQDRLVVRTAPSSSAKRRGVVAKGARLPALARKAGPGCDGYWYRVHDEAWVCQKAARPGDEPPLASALPRMEEGDVTPWPYAFVREPTIEYEAKRGVLFELRDLLEGYGFGVKRIVHLDEGAFFETVEGRLIPREAAGVTGRVSEHTGMEIVDGGPWPIGWVNAKGAHAYAAPSRNRRHRLGPVDRYSPFEVLETVGVGAKRFVRFDDGAWLWGKDVRVAREATRPSGVGENERWIDIDVTEQIATAYEGDRPVYATLVSTGRAGASRTVKGEYRIWIKVAAIAMDNTDEELDESENDGASIDAGVAEEERHLFSLQDVPWTQFFHENYALHGVYWHDRFGNRRSHGCVNLAPRDARWFYEWTRPSVPQGWWAINATEKDPGTLVRIR